MPQEQCHKSACVKQQKSKHTADEYTTPLPNFIRGSKFTDH